MASNFNPKYVEKRIGKNGQWYYIYDNKGKAYGKAKDFVNAAKKAGRKFYKRTKETISRMINKGKGRAREILNRLGLRKRRAFGTGAGAPYDLSKGKWAGRKSLGKNSVGAPSDIKLERGKWAGRKNGAKSSAGMPSNKRG